MDWEVTVQMNGMGSSYLVTAPKYYEAKVKGLSRFLEEYQIPGRPYEFLTSKRELVQVKVKALEDRRRGTREAPGLTFYLDQVESLKKFIRTSETLDWDTKTRSVELLRDLVRTLKGDQYFEPDDSPYDPLAGQSVHGASE